MDLSQEDIELIDRFSRNELQGDELESFTKRLREDSNFAAEVRSYGNTLSAINVMGRDELRSQLSDIKKELDQEGNYDKYKKGGGKGGGYIVFIIIVGIVGYLFYSGFFKTNFSGEHNAPLPAKDTVYHIRINRDTIYKSGFDSTHTSRSKKSIIIFQNADTTYFEEKSNIDTSKETKVILKPDSTIMKTDTLFFNANEKDKLMKSVHGVQNENSNTGRKGVLKSVRIEKGMTRDTSIEILDTLDTKK